MLDSRARVRPKGMLWDEIKEYPITSLKWRRSKLWVCATCKRCAYYNPYTDTLWGCRTCGFVTDNILKRFISRKSLTKKDASPPYEFPVKEGEKS